MQNVLGEPLGTVFTVAHDLGFDGVELDWMDPAEVRAGGPLAPERRAAVREAAQAAGVAIPSVCAHFLNNGGLASPDAALQKVGVNAVREGIALCRDLGASVLLVPFFFKGGIEGGEGKARLTEHLRRLAPEAEAAGVTVAIEHTLPGAEAARLLAEVGSPRVADYWDMANCFCFSYDPITEVEALTGHLAQVHAKEFFAESGGPAGTQESPRYDALNKKPFGQGQVPVAEVFAALCRVGYDGWVVLETGAFGGDRKASARAALNVLKAANGA